jgi:2-polyprenyl-3-methyl-5-hydroxy-6-metoxy-1,4-benzoquinol methylase
MSLQVYYEDSFKSERSRSAADLKSEVLSSSRGLFLYVQESKNKFLSDLDWKDLKVLVLGAGRGGVGLHIANMGSDVTLVDFSPSALAQAEKVFASEGLSVKTIKGDVTYPDVNFDQEYDLIVDSHLLHCLTENPDRTSYYRLVSDHLSNRGIFVVETMVHRKKLFVPDGFMFDKNFVLWQMFGKWTAVRKILDSLDLEAELKSAGFSIEYFMYYAQYSFVPHKTFMEIPNEVLPAAVRLVVRNGQAFK